MSVRKLFGAVALSAGLAGVPSTVMAAEPVPAGGYTFATLKPLPAAEAKAKAAKWLTGVGRYTDEGFERAWGKGDRPTLDRVADVLALGNPDAAAALAVARAADGAAPAAIPAVLRDAKQDPFFRTNLAVAFAKAAGTRKAYEEALEALNAVPPEPAVEPAAYFFFKAVAEHALVKKDVAAGSLLKLLGEVADVPDRYRVVGTQMLWELGGWAADPKDLTNIGRLMDNSGRRLDLGRPGEKTQDIQKKIVFRLDELIKDLENQSNCKDGQCNGGNCPNGGKPGSGQANGNTLNPSKPAADSTIMGGSGQGKVDERALRQYAEQWGGLPAEKRAAIVEELNRDLPKKYEPLIKEYFDALDRTNGFPKR